MYNNFVNTPSGCNPRNLGFYISPDITIEYVRPKAQQPTAHTPVQISHHQYVFDDDHDDDDDSSSYDSYDYDDDDDDCGDPYFNPLTFCAITMDKDDDEQERKSADLAVTRVDPLKMVKKAKTSTLQSNENSSFVCNGTDAAAKMGVKPKKRHSCHICPKTFGWTTDLKRHLLIHTGERPFKCTMCLATFTRNFLLQKHKAKMHQCLSPNEVSQLNNNVAKNLMEIKLKMRELENSKNEIKNSGECLTE